MRSANLEFEGGRLADQICLVVASTRNNLNALPPSSPLNMRNSQLRDTTKGMKHSATGMYAPQATN